LVRYQDIADAQARNQALLLAMQVDAETTLSIVDRERYIRDFLQAHGFKATHLRPAASSAGGEAGLAPLFRMLGTAGDATQTAEEEK
jgi:hypothetical protein